MTGARIVNVGKGQTLQLRFGRGAHALSLLVEREPGGAVLVRNEQTGNIIRQWTSKEVRSNA